MRKPGEVNVSNFKDKEGKYISTVFDEEGKSDDTIYKTSRTHIRASYINSKDQITEIKLEKYIIKNGVMQSNPDVIRINTSNLDTLIKFLDFLIGADISSVSAGKLSFEKDIELDPDLESKLRALASDNKGKQKLLALFDEGYLTSDLDVPDLIKRGLSRKTIDEKFTKLEEFEKLINEDDVKEVGDIQVWLKNNPWIFGPEYKSLDFRKAGRMGNPDGRLLRIDGLTDILEVKLPTAEILRNDGQKRQYISPDLAEAIGQLTGYLEYYYDAYSTDYNDLTEEEIHEEVYGKYYKPKGILLIGRRSMEDGTNTMSKTIHAKPKNLRRLLSYFHWVEVLTYDDLIDRARNGVTRLLD